MPPASPDTQLPTHHPQAVILTRVFASSAPPSSPSTIHIPIGSSQTSHRTSCGPPPSRCHTHVCVSPPLPPLPPSTIPTHTPSHVLHTRPLFIAPQDKLQASWDTTSWEEVYPADIPRQENGFDCGVFALMFCNRMGVRGAGFDFTQDDIRHNIRAAIVCDMLDGRIAATAWRG